MCAAAEWHPRSWKGHPVLHPQCCRAVGTQERQSHQRLVHLQDIIRGVDFAFGKRLRDFALWTISNSPVVSCQHSVMTGLPPVIWDNHDRPGTRIFNARVSNARLREVGFQPSVSPCLTRCSLSSRQTASCLARSWRLNRSSFDFSTRIQHFPFISRCRCKAGLRDPRSPPCVD